MDKDSSKESSINTEKNVLQLRKKEKKQEKSQSFHEGEGLEDHGESHAARQSKSKKEIYEEIRTNLRSEYSDDEDDRCCPEEEMSSQGSDYFRKPSNVDISPPPEPSETVLTRQQEFLKHYEKLRLTQQQADCFTVIMQDAFYQLSILNNSNRMLLEDLAEMAKKEEKQSGDGDKSQDPIHMNSVALKLAKMESDRLYTTDIFAKVYLDLKINNSFPTLLVHLSDLSAKSYQIIAREIHYKELKSKWRKLTAKLANNIEDHKNGIIQIDKEIYKLMDDIDDSTWNCEIRTRYVDAWQNAQTEQHTAAIKRTEGGPLGTINNTNDLIDKENRIHNEIMSYFKASMEDYTDQIEKWMERFDREIDQLDMDIRVMKENRDIQTDETNELQALLDEHKREMDAWQAVLDERARKKALEELMIVCAIQIQAWWRGVMARKLFKKLLKKKKKGKKGKKGKK